VTVLLPLGIHAAIAHHLVQLAVLFRSSIFLSYGGRTASLQSIPAILALGAPHGCELGILADGIDEAAAATAIALVLTSPTDPGRPERLAADNLAG
jgi:phosphotransferase system HPr (HPr) family protein